MLHQAWIDASNAKDTLFEYLRSAGYRLTHCHEDAHGTGIAIVGRDERFSSGVPLIGMQSVPALPNLPHLWPTFATPLLPPTRRKPIPMQDVMTIYKQ